METIARLKRKLDDAKRTGTLWIEGEMEFAYPCTYGQALQVGIKVAEACGYLVQGGPSRLTIYPPHCDGYYVLDWFHQDALGPEKIEYWSSVNAYADDLVATGTH